MTFQDFLQKQDAIYNDFRSFMNDAKSNGCTIPKVESKTRHGFILSFDFGNQLQDIHIKINTALETTPYKPLTFDILHSTVSVSKSNVELNDLTSINKIYADFKNNLDSVSFEFREILYNADSVILAGYPNNYYWQFCEAIVEQLNSQTTMEFRLPKMAHITFARTFNQEDVRLDENLIAEINEKLSPIELPIKLKPKSLHLGQFEHSREGFTFRPISS